MKDRMIKLSSLLLAGVMALSNMGVPAHAMNVSGETSQSGFAVKVTASEIETVVKETKSELTAVLPEDYEGRKETYLSHFFTSNYSDKVSIDDIVVTGAPSGYPFKYVGYGDYSKQWVSKAYVTYEKDANGNAQKDANGNYIIKSLTKTNGTVITSGGVPATELDAVYDQKTGVRAQQFLLKNEAGNVVSAYCVDLGMDTVGMDADGTGGAWYAVANLEDNDYYASEDAENHIRAIVFNGYWGTANTPDENGVYPTGSLERIKANLKDALKKGEIDREYTISYGKYKSEKEIDGVETKKVVLTEDIINGLTEGEAVDMTQAAIWSYSNGAQAVQDGKDGWVVTGTTYGDTYRGNDTKKDNPEGAARMTALYDWLMGLEPQAGSTEVINADNFLDDLNLKVGDKVEGTEDKYKVDLRFTLATVPTDKDDLVLEVAYDGGTITKRLAGVNAEGEEYEMLEAENGIYTIKGFELAADEIFSVTMNIKGKQYLERDAYIYTAEGGIDYSQTMVGIAEGVQSVDVSMSVDLTFTLEECPDRILHIYKYNNISEGDLSGDGTEEEIDTAVHTHALANVSFSIYKVCALEDLESVNGEAPAVVLGKAPEEAEIATYCTEDNYVTTLTTDALGHAMYTFGDASSDGVYLVVEEDNPAIAVKAKPFFVSLPMTNPDGDGWLYTVYVYPKNDLEPAPVVDKDVTEVGNDYGTFDMDENITYIIRGEIPAGLATAEVYALSDTLDTRLDYEGNVIVKLYTEAETEIVLGDIVHYTLTETEATTDKGASLKVELTKSGMEYVMENLGTDVENVEPEIRVYFNASLNSSADLGILIPNNATIDYTNSTGYKYMPGEVPEEERPEVETGGINILKKDATDTNIVLSGAEFKLARDVKEGENTEERLVVDGTVKKVVYVDFYDATGEKVFDVTTDEKGEAVISGLAYGEYYLVEVKAPAGYNLLTKPVKVTINKQSHTEGAEYVVLNSNQFRLPETGGVGTTIFTVSGMAMLAAAVVLLLKKKDSEEA